MKVFLAPFLLLPWVALPALAGQPLNRAEQAIRQIEKVGGVVHRDATRPGSPVVSLEFTSCTLDDNVLGELHRFPDLEWLDL